MSVSDLCKHYRLFVFWPILIVFLAVFCGHNNVVSGQMSQVELAVDSACDQISRGDFESAQEIVRKSINIFINFHLFPLSGYRHKRQSHI